MARLSRQNQGPLTDTSSLRLRAAWLYHNRGLTQKEIADDLGISRSTVIRMLDEARKRAEVQIWINPVPGDCTDLAMAIEEKYDITQVIVVPGDGTPEETAKDVGAALGRYLSEHISDDMTVGVTWGRTLQASLQTFRPHTRSNARVVSLVGGILETKGLNPVEFSWQLASRLGAECMLYLAPLFVDSARTKNNLIDHCGLNRLHKVATDMDIAIISCGDLTTDGSSLILEHLNTKEQQELLASGAICDVACNFLDAQGRDAEHSIRERSMSVDMDTISSARHVVLAAGGAKRAASIHATIKRTRCQTLVTNEAAATVLLTL